MRLRLKLPRPPAKLSVILSTLLLVMSSGARTHRHWGQGFSVDLNSPYDQVIKIVRQVTEDGVIRGTWQYRLTPCAVLFIFFYLQVEIQPSCADTSATV